jgi:nucleoside-diphosphate-sugar epimerase
MNVVVIGGTRFIGPEVVQQLLRKGHDVTVFHRGQSTDSRAVAARHILGNRKELTSFRGEFARLGPAVVLDMLPMNAGDATALIDTFSGIAGRVVVISSADVYLAYGRLWNSEPGPVQPTPLTEDAPLRETDQPHGQKYDKIGMERAVGGRSDLPATVLRLPMVYGRSDPQHRLYPYLKRMDDGRPVILLDDVHAAWKWTRGYVENVASAICLAVTDDRAAGRVYNIGEEPVPTEIEWVRSIARCVGWRGKIAALPGARLPEHLQTSYNFLQHMETDTSRIRQELGHIDQVSREEGMIRTVEWERAHPPDKIDPADYDYDAEDTALRKFGLYIRD